MEGRRVASPSSGCAVSALLLCVAVIRASAQPQTQSSTPTPVPTPTPSPSAPPAPLCPASVCAQYAFAPSSEWQYWDVPASGQPWLWVLLWGAGGSQWEGVGGHGAFVSGALAVQPGEQLRVIVGSVNRAQNPELPPAEISGCGAYWSGGRSAIQRHDAASGSWSDVVTAGGGGGGNDNEYSSSATGGNAGCGLSGAASQSGAKAGQSDASGACVQGVRDCGGGTSPGGYIGGGGGWRPQRRRFLRWRWLLLLGSSLVPHPHRRNYRQFL